MGLYFIFKAMTKYRILEIPQPDGGNKYRIYEIELRKPAWWKFSNDIIERHHRLNRKGQRWFLPLIYIPDFAHCLDDFNMEDEAKAYIEFLGRQPKVVFETEA